MVDSQKVKEMKFATSSFESFIGLRSFFVMGDLIFHLATMFFKVLQENIINPILDPYIPEDLLLVKINEKITINLGKFFVETAKVLILCFITYLIFVYTEPYFKKLSKK